MSSTTTTTTTMNNSSGNHAAGNSHSRKSSGPASSTNSNATAPPTPQQQAQGTAGGATAPALQLTELLGAQLRLTLNAGARDKERPIVSGSLWCYDPSYGCLVLSSPSSSYRIVRLSSIQSVQVLSDPSPTTSGSSSSSDKATEVELKPINPDRIREREQQAVAAEQKRLANLPPPGVSELGKELYDALGKTMPVRWAGTTM